MMVHLIMAVIIAAVAAILLLAVMLVVVVGRPVAMPMTIVIVIRLPCPTVPVVVSRGPARQ